MEGGTEGRREGGKEGRREGGKEGGKKEGNGPASRNSGPMLPASRLSSQSTLQIFLTITSTGHKHKQVPIP
jgi:hypothetical protein